jgi:sugar phosphate isomerase/epimerase
MRRVTPEAALLAAIALAPVAAGDFSKDLFAFDNGTGRDQKLALAAQARLLKETGYRGMAVFTGTAHIPAALSALDAQKLRLLSIYVHSFVDGTTPRIDAGLAAAIEQLAGRETMILLTVQGHGKDAEQRAVENVREVADMAARSGLRVCLYPHIGFYVETTPDALRIAAKAGRANVGVALNLYHTVAFHAARCADGDLDLRRLVKTALPRLWLVSINGMDWKDGAPTIERLGDGAYDVARVLRLLKDAGYSGPVGQQCYRVPGDLRENLARSHAAWRDMLKRIGR